MIPFFTGSLNADLRGFKGSSRREAFSLYLIYALIFVFYAPRS